MPSDKIESPEQSLPDKPPRQNQYEIIDGREVWRFWVPEYVVSHYAERIKAVGLACYQSLAWWTCRAAPHHQPSLKEIGKRAGLSRATVWRVLKVLVANSLILIEPNVGPTGRRAHRIRLIHPPEILEQIGSQGTNLAGALTVSAPSVDELRSNVCVNSGHTHTPENDAENASPLPAEQIVAQWVAQLLPGADSWNAAQRAAIEATAPLLLARGYCVEYLTASIARPDRPVNEWPRDWAKRVLATPPRVAPRPAHEVESPPDGIGANAGSPSLEELIDLGGGSITLGSRRWNELQQAKQPGGDCRQVNGGESTPPSSISSGADTSQPGAANG